MVGMGELSAGVSSLKSAIDILGAILKLRLDTQVQSKVIDLQREILSAQASAIRAQIEQGSLLDKISALETKVAQFEDWSAEAQKYELQELRMGTRTFAYRIKEAMRAVEPDHWLCPNCYTNRQKSILQTATTPGRMTVYSCAKCGNKFQHHGI